MKKEKSSLIRKVVAIAIPLIALFILLAVLAVFQLAPSVAYACPGNTDCGQPHGGGGLGTGGVIAISVIAGAIGVGIIVGILVYYFKARKKKNRASASTKRVQQKSKKAAPSQPATVRKVGRNDPCPCGSGSKFKMCCGD